MGTLAYGTGSSSYYDKARQGQVFSAFATVTAPVIYSTAAGTGGPLLWNNTGPAGSAGLPRVMAVLLALGAGITVASTVASALGITGNSGQTSAPTSTSAIGGVANTLVGGAAPLCNLYSTGTPANAGGFFQPTHTLDTGAITVNNIGPAWVDLGGVIVVPPGSWVSVAAAATATTAVVKVGLIWAEVPY